MHLLTKPVISLLISKPMHPIYVLQFVFELKVVGVVVKYWSVSSVLQKTSF